MARAIIVNEETGLVVNVIVFDPYLPEAQQYQPPPGHILVVDETHEIDDVYGI